MKKRTQFLFLGLALSISLLGIYFFVSPNNSSEKSDSLPTEEVSSERPYTGGENLATDNLAELRTINKKIAELTPYRISLDLYGTSSSGNYEVPMEATINSYKHHNDMDNRIIIFYILPEKNIHIFKDEDSETLTNLDTAMIENIVMTEYETNEERLEAATCMIISEIYTLGNYKTTPEIKALLKKYAEEPPRNYIPLAGVGVFCVIAVSAFTLYRKNYK